MRDSLGSDPVAGVCGLVFPMVISGRHSAQFGVGWGFVSADALGLAHEQKKSLHKLGTHRNLKAIQANTGISGLFGPKQENSGPFGQTRIFQGFSDENRNFRAFRAKTGISGPFGEKSGNSGVFGFFRAFLGFFRAKCGQLAQKG